MSRAIEDLQAEMQPLARQFVANCQAAGLEVKIYFTLRTYEEQARLYRQGRPLSEIQQKADSLRNDWGRPDLADILMNVGPQNGDMVTKAGPGQSLHNYGWAFDVAPVINGDLNWDTDDAGMARWQQLGAIGQALNLEWGGAWTNFKDYPHFQSPGKDWKTLIRA